MKPTESTKKILESDAGKEIRDYLTESLYELKDIDSLEILHTPSHQLIELKAQKKAYNKLKEILSLLITISEPEQTKDARDSFNVE